MLSEPIFRALQVALVISIGAGMAGAILAWGKRDEPGAVPILALLIGQCWWSASLFFQLQADTHAAKILWIDVSWLGVVVVPVAWLFFSLEYTGHTQYLTRRNLVIVAVIPVITAALSLTNEYHNLLYVNAAMVEHQGLTTMHRDPGIWYWAIAGYTYLLGVVAAVLLLQYLTSQVATFRGQSVTLLGGMLAPWVTNAVHLAGVLPTGGVDPTPVAFCVTGLACLGAITRFQLFGTNPAPIRPARRSLFQRMEEAALIVDRSGTLLEMNERAAEVLGVEREEVVGAPFGDVFPDLQAVLEGDASESPYRPGTEGRSFDVGVSPLDDTTGRPIGRVVTLHDITEYVRHQQRLRVLYRMFRHNIRGIVQLLIGEANSIDELDPEAAAAVREQAEEINEISEEIRTALSIFDAAHQRPEPENLQVLLEEAIDSVRSAYPDVWVEGPDAGPDVAVDALIEVGLEHVFENAAEHNRSASPKVWIETERHGETVTVSVADNGPGIDASELVLLEQGMETPLEHGSGIGLALAIWATELANGDISFEERDPSGLCVTFELPILDADVPPIDEGPRPVAPPVGE